jgi:hypothetical protein
MKRKQPGDTRTDIRPAGVRIGPMVRHRGLALGAEVSEREGSRIGVFLFGEVRVFHRPHPSPDTDKGAVASIRKWLDSHGVKP